MPGTGTPLSQKELLELLAKIKKEAENASSALNNLIDIMDTRLEETIIRKD